MALKTYISNFITRLVPYDYLVSGTSEQWKAWTEITKLKHPISYFLFETLPDFVSGYYFRLIKNTYYGIKCKYFLKYHHIKIDVDRFMNEDGETPSLQNYSWYDSDTKILYGNFQILVDYVEKEKPGEIIDWSHDKEHRQVWKEINELYTWWIEDRPNRYKENPAPNMEDFGAKFGELGNGRNPSPEYKAWSKACGEYHQIELEWDNEDTEMLIRLVAIRKWMWT